MMSEYSGYVNICCAQNSDCMLLLICYTSTIVSRGHFFLIEFLPCIEIPTACHICNENFIWAVVAKGGLKSAAKGGYDK